MSLTRHNPLRFGIPGVTPGRPRSCYTVGSAPSSGKDNMDEADYLRDQAAKLRERAQKAKNPKARRELLDHAVACEEIANDIDDRAVSG